MLGKNLDLIFAGVGGKFLDAASKLNAMSPLAVLERGYSITYGGSPEAILRDSSVLLPGDEIRTVLSKGRIKSRVEEVER
jgi:exodeoxyribonuclease VII large subunit